MWEIDELRKKELISIFSVCSYRDIENMLLKHINQITVNEYLYLQDCYAENMDGFNIPRHVADFLGQYVLEYSAKNILIPYDWNGAISAYLAYNFPHMNITVVVRDTPFSKQVLSGFTLPNMSIVMDIDVTTSYDVMLTLPPVGLKPITKTFNTGSAGELNISDDPSRFLILEYGPLISDNGSLLFLTTNSFAALTSNVKSVRYNLSNFDLYLNAALLVEPNTFRHTAAEFNVVILSKKQSTELYIAGFPKPSDDITDKVQRLSNRQQSAYPINGRLIGFDDFRGISQHIAKEHYIKQCKTLAFLPYEASNLIISINKPHKENDLFVFDDVLDSLYLPKSMHKNATTDLSEISSGQYFLQLVVKSNIVNPVYLAKYLNSVHGINFRLQLSTGNTIHMICEENLAKSTIYLPDISFQNKFTQAINKVDSIVQNLLESKERLWFDTTYLDSLNDDLSIYSSADKFENWIESLPFPIASILRTYQTQDFSSKSKCERLLHFFEAITEFFVAIHMSAFRNSMYWVDLKTKIASALKTNNLHPDRASYGLWIVMLQIFSKHCRDLKVNKEKADRGPKADKEKADNPLSLFMMNNFLVYDVISSKTILSTLEKVNQYRNRWKGHGGATSPEEDDKRLEILTKELSNIRSIIGWAFKQYLLISPFDLKSKKGPISTGSVKLVQGSNPQLPFIPIELNQHIYNDCLYLYTPDYATALEMVPIISVQEAPQPAGYFYSRVVNNTAQMVTYQITSQSEIVGINDDLISLLSEFK